MSGGPNQMQTEEQTADSVIVKVGEKLSQRDVLRLVLSAPFSTYIEGLRLNTRDELYNILGIDPGTAKKLERESKGKKTADQVIIDVAINDGLRELIEEHRHHEGFIEKVKKTPKRTIIGMFRAATSPLDYLNNKNDNVTSEIKEYFGHASDPVAMKQHLNDKLRPVLAHLQQPEIDRLNDIVGVSAGQSLAPDILITMAPTQLEMARTVLQHQLHHNHDLEHAFDHLLQFRIVEGKAKAKVLNPLIYNSARLRADVVGSLKQPANKKLNDLVEDLAGTKYADKLEDSPDLRKFMVLVESRMQTTKDKAQLEADFTKILDAYPRDKRTVKLRELTPDEEKNNGEVDKLFQATLEVGEKVTKKHAEKKEVDNELNEAKEDRDNVTKKDSISYIKKEYKDAKEANDQWIENERKTRHNIIKTISDLTRDKLKADGELRDLKDREPALQKWINDERKRPQAQQDQTNLTAWDTELKAIPGKRATAQAAATNADNELKNNEKLKLDADNGIATKEHENDILKEKYKDLPDREQKNKAKIAELEAKVKALDKEIPAEEQAFREAANKLVKLIEGTLLKKADDYPTIKVIKDAISKKPFDAAMLTEISKLCSDIVTKNTYENEMAKLKAVSTEIKPIPAQLLLFELRKLEAGRLPEAKRYSPKQIGKLAAVASNFDTADADTSELFRKANNMMAAASVEGFFGFRMLGLGGLARRRKQAIAGRFFDSGTVTGRGLLQHIGGLEVHSLEFLKDLPINASQADMQAAMEHHGPVKKEDIMQLYLRLRAVMVPGKDGVMPKTVNIADNDVAVINLALYARRLLAMAQAKEFFHAIENPDDAAKASKEKNVAQYFIDLTNNSGKTLKELESAQLEILRSPDSDWQVSWLKSKMKEKYGAKIEELMKEARKRGLSGRDIRKFVEREGHIPKTIADQLMKNWAIKETLSVGKDGVKAGVIWTASKLYGLTSALARGGASIVRGGWNHVVYPLGKGGAGALGFLGRNAYKAIKFLGFDVPVFFYWKAPVWTAKKLWKGMVFPFALAGSTLKKTWNFFDYNDEKAIRDAKWYKEKLDKEAAAKAAKEAKSHGAGHGSHGGADHGGDHAKKEGDHAQEADHKAETPHEKPAAPKALPHVEVPAAAPANDAHLKAA